VVALASMDINDNVQFAVLRNGTVAGWGSNRGAQAGCGQVDVSTATLTAPRAVNGLQSIFAAAAGTAHALVRRPRRRRVRLRQQRQRPAG
jgi:alpha-tubulin suppressor-like RCC1 family protein